MKKCSMFFAVTLAILCCFAFAYFKRNYEVRVLANTSKVSTTSTSSAVEKAAFSNNESYIIVLDAGHGGYDSGSVSEDGVLEKDITLSLTLKVGALLSQEGYQIIYTRTSDEVTWESDNLSDLKARTAISSQANADYFISIHTNFSSYNDGAYGFETYLDDQDETIVEMASAIHEELSALQFSMDRGLKSTAESSLYVIDHNATAAMLLEVGFLSDSDDAATLINDQDALAQAIANGIIATL